MGVSRRSFMALVGGVVGSVSTAVLSMPKWLRDLQTEPPAGSPDDPLPVDVLVVGGGVQGLVTLRLLLEKGYAAALVTNAPLGQGQTLHSHGSLNSGYAFPREDLRTALKQDWLPFAKRSGLQMYGEDQFYYLMPPEPLAKLRPGWDAFGYEYELVSPDRLPAGIQQGDQFRDDADTHVVKVREYTVPKRQLIRVLSDGAHDRIIHGSIESFHCVPTDSDDGSSFGVQTVAIRTRNAGKTVSLRPAMVITATGTGTSKLIHSLARDPSLAAAARKPAELDAWKESVLSQIEEVKCRNLHMLCVRGPRSVLPAVNLMVVEHRLMIIAADVDATHDRRNEGADGLVTWYVTPLDPSIEPTAAVPDTAEGATEAETVVDGFRKLLNVCPSLKSKAEAQGSKLEFAAYAGYKQDIGDEPNRPVCRRLKGLDNVIVTLPSLVPGAFVNARKALELVEEAAAPTGRQISLGGAAGEVEIGHVTENSDGFEWMNWNQLLEAFPGIES